MRRGILCAMLFACFAPMPLWARCDGASVTGLNQRQSLILDTLNKDAIKKNIDQQADETWNNAKGMVYDPVLAWHLSAQLREIKQRCTNQALRKLMEVDEQLFNEDEVKTLARVAKLKAVRDTRDFTEDEMNFLDEFQESPLQDKTRDLPEQQEAAVNEATTAMNEEFSAKLKAALPNYVAGPNEAPMPPPAPRIY